MTTSFVQQLHQEHQECDQAFAEAEVAALKGRLDAAKEPVEKCIHLNRRHFEIEETLLFPAFEAATGSQGGPTQVMRMEHEQMKALLQRMETAFHEGDLTQLARVGETLMILMQQHNLKEENMLYPMMDQVLAPQREKLIEELKNYPR